MRMCRGFIFLIQSAQFIPGSDEGQLCPNDEEEGDPLTLPEPDVGEVEPILPPALARKQLQLLKASEIRSQKRKGDSEDLDRPNP